MFEIAFNNLDRVMRNDEGLASELDYAEQTSWLLFLKYLDDMEREWAGEAALERRDHVPLLDERYRWQTWAVPKSAGGTVSLNALTGSDLIEFVNRELFPYLKSFRSTRGSSDSLEYKIGEVFSEITNGFRSGYSLREALEIIDTLSFGTSESKHELSDLYETRIRRMGNAGRNGGEYYTPRPLIRAMIEIVKPQIGETIYDGACGSGGFLCEAFEFMRRDDLSASEWEKLQTGTFYGQEKKSLAYVLGVMNLILHGVDSPNIRHTNTLAENVMDIQEKDRHDVVLANPPFGGGERREVQQNFPIKSGETAYLFLQHFIRKLKAGGRGAVVIKNTFLSNADSASVQLRKELLSTCNLHTVLDCPSGTFLGAGVNTVVLFFEKGTPTSNIWYYKLDPGRSLGKTNPLNDDDLAEFVALQTEKLNSDKSWTVVIDSPEAASRDLSTRNPNGLSEMQVRSPDEIVSRMLEREKEARALLEEIQAFAAESQILTLANCQTAALEELAHVEFGTRVTRKHNAGTLYPVYGGGGATFSTDTYNRENSFIVSRFGMSEECVRYVPGKFFLNDSGLTVRTRDASCLSQKFLDIFLLGSQSEIYALGRGAAQKNLNVNAFKKLQIPVPSSAQQEQIVTILHKALDKLREVQDSAEASLVDSRELRQALFQRAFSGQGD